MLDMATRGGVPVAEIAGVGVALRTMIATSSRRQAQPGSPDTGHVDVEDEQLPLFGESR